RFYLSPRAGRGRPPERSVGGRVRERCRKPQAPPHPARNFVARHPLRARGEREKSIRILDIGAGTGVLAIAAARALRRPVLASDIDRLAVKVARANARANKAGALIEIIHAGDLHHRRFRAGAPFDIILANILLVPLQRMARPLAQLVAPGGKVVLSGLLTSQALAALAAYRAQGLVLERRIVLEGWTTLVMKRPTLPP
ncbi:MAG: 50S ribosomal protein L11 methyltransferase, partial [Xanthobacteraceae bacterium]